MCDDVITMLINSIGLALIVSFIANIFNFNLVIGIFNDCFWLDDIVHIQIHDSELFTLPRIVIDQ